jgi:hypothetical protein
LNARWPATRSVPKDTDQATPGGIDEQPAPATTPALSPRGGDGLDVGYEHLRETALHARAEALPLGFAVLRRGGVTTWRRTLRGLSSPPTTTPAPIPRTVAAPAGPRHIPTPLPTALATELIHILAAVALAEPTPDPLPPPLSAIRGDPIDVHRHRVVKG